MMWTDDDQRMCGNALVIAKSSRLGNTEPTVRWLEALLLRPHAPPPPPQAGSLGGGFAARQHPEQPRASTDPVAARCELVPPIADGHLAWARCPCSPDARPDCEDVP